MKLIYILIVGFLLVQFSRINAQPVVDFNRYVTLADTIPADFPKITINSSDNPSPGLIFLTSLGFGGKTANYLMVLDSLAKPFYYIKPFVAGIDFKMQTNGQFSYATPIKLGDTYQVGPISVTNAFVIENVLDQSFKAVDNVQCKNGYLADTHDFKILPNGNYLMIAYEKVPVDMSKIIENGNPNSFVVQTVFQELDNKKNCVFQWRSLDNIPITDTHDNMQNTIFEHVHGNSIIQDYDGNFLVSLASTFNILKIDRITGKTIWELGGKNNKFNFIGEHQENSPNYFNMQHDLNRLTNGNLLFFDNGASRKPAYARAVEYKLDEENKTATMVWDYRHTPDISSAAMGSAQRLPNGNTLIGWGLVYAGLYRTATEVRPDKTTAYELSIPSDAFSYRVSKHVSPFCPPLAEVMIIETKESNTYKFKNKTEETGVQMYFKQLSAFIYNEFTVAKYDCSPLNPLFSGENPVTFPGRYVLSNRFITSYSGEIRFYTSSLPPLTNPDSMKVFYRPEEGKGTFIMLPTHYDLTENQIVANANDIGEYVLGFYQPATEILPPILVSPSNNQDLTYTYNLLLTWSPTGRYDKFLVQVSYDSLFTEPLQSNGEFSSPNLQILWIDPNLNKPYFWRVRTYYKNLTSDWSTVKRFKFSDPFISIQIPNGNEVWYKDTMLKIIRWKTNLKDSLTISLYKNGSKQATIKDTIFSYTNGYAWKIPTNILVDSTYKIEIKSLKNTGLSTMSANSFTIKDHPTDVEENKSNNSQYIKLYPNPFSNETKFEIQIDKPSMINLTIFDVNGNEIRCLINEYIFTDKYEINWDTHDLPNGVYYFTIKVDTNVETGSCVLMRK